MSMHYTTNLTTTVCGQSTATVIADTTCNGKRITTYELVFPRYIHAELLTHRCLAGQTVLDFDLPTPQSCGSRRIYSMSIAEFCDKWENGSTPCNAPRTVNLDMSKLDMNREYDVKEIAAIYGISKANIFTACREGKLKHRRIGRSVYVLGKDFAKYRATVGTGRRFSLKSRLSAMRLRCYDENSGNVVYTHITDCWHVGRKKTYKLSAGEYEITATADHLILTMDGWKELQDITPGVDLVICNSRKLYEEPVTDRYKKINGNWVSTWVNRVKPSVIARQKGCCFSCGKKLKAVDIHHVKPKHLHPELAFDINNVVALCPRCHKKQHRVQGWQGKSQCNALPVLVDDIKYVGVQDVYDLSVDSDQHNFFANSIVVHNCFSRNASSSRATPIAVTCAEVENDPVFFDSIGLNQPGMVAGAEIPDDQKELFKKEWIELGQYVASKVRDWNSRFHIHKQVLNRALEPWLRIRVILTSTAWENFFKLRLAPDAKPEMRNLALAMQQAREASFVNESEYHTPYWDSPFEKDDFYTRVAPSCVARCARVSYLKHDRTAPTLKEDMELYRRLYNSGHCSPFEHVAIAHEGRFANFDGWESLRHLFFGLSID